MRGLRRKGLSMSITTSTILILIFVLVGIVAATIRIVNEIKAVKDKIETRLYILNKKIDKFQAHIGKLDDELTQIRQFYEDSDYKETFYEEEG